MLRSLSRRKSLNVPSIGEKFIIYFLLIGWTIVVLFPIYWLVVTSFKLPIDVNKGPFYIPFVDFKPSLHAWEYILVGDLANDTRRNFLNTLVVAPTSAAIALLLGTAAAYALIRFEYRPRLGSILSFIVCLGLAVFAITLGAPWQVALASMLALFFIFILTIGRRFKRSLKNNDIAFWLISQRMLPPVAAKAAHRPFTIGFTTPKEGAVLAVDGFVLHKSGRRPDLAHCFIDFMLEGRNAADVSKLIGAGNPNAAAMAFIAPEIASEAAIFPPASDLDRLEMLRDFDPALRRTLSRLWTEIKVR